eukprot:6021632-Amphidinium_carterae.1
MGWIAGQSSQPSSLWEFAYGARHMEGISGPGQIGQTAHTAHSHMMAVECFEASFCQKLYVQVCVSKSVPEHEDKQSIAFTYNLLFGLKMH